MRRVLALRDRMDFGFVLPCRSWEPIDVDRVGRVARLAEERGFADLWVTENTLDHAFSFDPMVVLGYAAAVTSTIRLGVSVVVLPLHHPAHVAHQGATLDYLSGGRAVIGVGLGRAPHYPDFGVPLERRVTRFLEGLEVIKALWTRPEAGFSGEFYTVEEGMVIKPVQQPRPPLWMGGVHPDSLRRAARVADGWMGAGGFSKNAFGEAVPIIRQALVDGGRDPADFPISRRVFMSIDDDPARAKEELLKWFTDVYLKPEMLETNGFYGTPSQVRDYIEQTHQDGATHMLLNPIARHEEQLEILADVVSTS